MSNAVTTENRIVIGDPSAPTGIKFTLDDEEWVCHDIKTLTELVEKFQAYATRDKYVRDLEDRVKHLESIL